MKTRERAGAGGGAHRTGAAAGQSQAQGQGVGERLPVAPRERKPALAALAVLLILVGALGATVLVLRAGNKVQAIKIIAPVAQGQSIPVSAMTEADVASGTGINYVLWSQRNDLGSFRAATNLVPGTALVGEMLTQQSGLASGKVLVGVSLKDGQYPSGLKAGDTVAAYLVSTDAGSGSSAGSGSGSGSGKSSSSAASGGNLLTASATVQSATAATDSNGVSSGNLPVTLVVNQSDAPALAQAASAGQVALVVVPSGSGSGS